MKLISNPTIKMRSAIFFAAALLLTTSQPAIVAGISHAQPDEEIEDAIEEEFDETLEEEFDEEFEEGFESDFEEEEDLEGDSEGGFDDDDLVDDPDEEFDEEAPGDEPEELEEHHDGPEGEEGENLEDEAYDDEENGESEDKDFEAEELEEIEEERDFEASFGATTELVFVSRDPEEFDVAGGEWLVLSDEDDVVELESRGFEVRAREEVDLLDQVMLRVSPPAGQDLLSSRELLLEVVPESQIDYNHLYQPQARFRRQAGGVNPLAAMPLSQAQQREQPKIGLIDTSVIKSASAFAKSNLVTRDFVNSRNRRPSQHGTAIATILVGQSKNYTGLLPRAQLYAASVFEILPGRGSTASTASLVRALNWMVKHQVPVVNMSLTGPRNAILQRAIDRARASNVLVVAAIGNNGPTARPLYPAAYENVISVTAVDTNNRVFRRANRGRYLDFSAPGVGILHYTPAGKLGTSTGTSIAAPFAAAAISLAKGNSHKVSAKALRETQGNAIDLGVPGRDSVYGFGLIQPPR